MFRAFVSQLLSWIWDRLDTILALLLGVVCSVLSLIGIIQSAIITSAVLGILTILAFSLMRDRSEREKLRQYVGLLVKRSETPDLDQVFFQQIDESLMLQEAEKEVWMVQETGNHIAESKKAHLASFLRKGGRLRIVVVNPNGGFIRQLAFRNHDLIYDAIMHRVKSFNFFIKGISRDVGDSTERLEIRYSNCIVGASSVFVDPTSSALAKRKAAIRYPGFRNPIEDRIGLIIQGETSPRLFAHFYQEARKLFEYASKVVLLAGAPKSGKTTMLMKLVESVSKEDNPYLFFVITHQQWKTNKQIGYEVVTGINSTPQNFARMRSDGDYEVDLNAWSVITGEIDKACKMKRIVVIDEIGSLQLRDPGFKNVIEKIINEPSISLFATLPLNNESIPIIQELKLHYRSTVLQLTSNANEQKEIESILRREFDTALFTAKTID